MAMVWRMVRLGSTIAELAAYRSTSAWSSYHHAAAAGTELEATHEEDEAAELRANPAPGAGDVAAQLRATAVSPLRDSFISDSGEETASRPADALARQRQATRERVSSGDVVALPQATAAPPLRTSHVVDSDGIETIRSARTLARQRQATRENARERAIAAAALAASSTPDFGSLEQTPARRARGKLHGAPRRRSELLPVHVPPLEPVEHASASASALSTAGAADEDDDGGSRGLSPLDSLAAKLRSPARGVCFLALGAWGANSRYSSNIYHQAEYILPMVEAAIMSARAPSAVLWPWPLLPWSRQLLGLLLPSTKILEGATALELGASASALRASTTCSREVAQFKAVGSGGGKAGYWAQERAPSLARKLVLRACKLPLRHSTGGRPLAVVLERGGLPHPAALAAASGAAAHGPWAVGGPTAPAATGEAATTASRRRHFADRGALQALLQASLPGWAIEWRSSAGADVRFCAQLGAWQGARLVITPHGAQMNNALFAHPRMVLVEAMPWAKRRYAGHLAMLRHSNIVHVRVHSQRPPASEGEWGDGRYSEEECEANELCGRFFRDWTNLHVDLRELHAALKANLPAADVRPWADVADVVSSARAKTLPPQPRFLTAQQR